MSESPLGNIGLVAVTLYVANLDAALAWYADNLGLTPMSLGSDGHDYEEIGTRFGRSAAHMERVEQLALYKSAHA